MLKLGGDDANTVPKYGVTAAEIAVLCAVHGSDAVFDIEPTTETVRRSAREERDRLLALYPAKDQDNNDIVLSVYPGMTPMLHTELADLGLDESLFKATQRAEPAAPKKIKPPKAAAKPAPITENAAASNDATHLFDDEPETDDVMN
jgi:hypothetical protein